MYKFKWKRFFFQPWYSSKTVAGHSYNQVHDKMDLFLKDGTLYSVGRWSKVDVFRLGADWIMATKKEMEKESGQKIALVNE